MQALKLVPTIHYFDTFKDFNNEFKLGKGDIIVSNERRDKQYIQPLGIDVPVIYREKYGKGEPSDEMIDAMKKDMDQYDYSRIIAFGGGTIVDICKVLALDVPDKSVKLFTGEVPLKKAKDLIIIPTTCGTGSEVTNVAIAELKSLHTKKGIAAEETFASAAVLIPEALDDLPDYVFATSSIDALIHASESYLSPKATPFTEMFSLSALKTILSGYKHIVATGKNDAAARKPLLKDFLIAACYAGIAFGNAGCAAVHAMSYALGANFHVPHGEANYQFFTEVFKMYMKKKPDGKIKEMNNIFADILGCNVTIVYDEIEKLLGQLVPKKPLEEYGMTADQIDQFTKSTVENQQRLLNNNYVPLSNDEIREIYANLF